MKKIVVTVALLAPLLLGAAIVEDGDGFKVYDEQKSEEITFFFEDKFFEDINVGTGQDFVPSGSPFQIKVNLIAGARSEMELKGTGVAQWPESVKLSYEGTENGGHASMNYGIEMEAFYKIAPPFGDGTEQEISEYLNFDLRFFDEKTFTPFLLDGNDENPVSMEDSIQDFHLWDGTLEDIIGAAIPIPIIGNIASMIHFSFDLDGIMYIEMFGSRIALDEKAQRSIFSDNQYLVIEPPLVNTTLIVEAHYESLVYYETDLILTITLTLKIPIFELELPIPITIPLVKENKEWIFNSQTVQFEFPAMFIEERAHQFLDTVPGDEDYWEFDIENIGTRRLEGRILSEDPNFIVLPEEFLLEPGEMSAVTVFFKPYEAGTKKGIIKFYSNDPVEPFTTVALFGYSSESGTFYSKVKEGDETRYEVRTEGGCSLSVVDQ
ncbi:MAG TPA: hypothetical protein PLV42_07385 [bacterium]|nr:hypothetical protein [bacterium]